MEGGRGQLPESDSLSRRREGVRGADNALCQNEAGKVSAVLTPPTDCVELERERERQQEQEEKTNREGRKEEMRVCHARCPAPQERTIYPILPRLINR